MCPVTSQCGTAASVVSQYLDVKLQPLVKNVLSYAHDSRHVLEKVRNLTLPRNARIFTSDATSMYTNIDPQEGLKAIEAYLKEFGNEPGDYLPMELILGLLKLVMSNNVFRFGDTYWLQIISTAMRAFCACAYATLFYAYPKGKIS